MKALRRNRLRIADRAARLLKERRVDPRMMPSGLLMSLLEAAGNCDDPDIAELWARLRAGAVMGEQAWRAIFVDVLRRMSSPEAAYFARMCELDLLPPRNAGPNRSMAADHATKHRILEIVCLNCRLDGATLCPTMRKPSDVLVEGSFSKESGGEGIRTPGAHEEHAGFQDRYLQPLSHPSEGVRNFTHAAALYHPRRKRGHPHANPRPTRSALRCPC